MKTKKKISLMVTVILLLQIILPMVSVIWESGLTLISRAEGDAQRNINTAQDLWDFAAEVNNGNTFEGVTINLTANIDLGCSEDNQWVPIGDYSSNSANVFKGTFDGNNHTISGLYIEKMSDYQGLFGVNHEGTIKNVNINNSKINAIDYVGGIAGYNYKGTIYNCSYNGTIICGIVSGSTAYGGGKTGGIVGYNSEGTIEKCYNNGTIDNTKAGGNAIGGIVGICNGGNVIDCYNTGKISGTTFGGIVGQVWGGANIKRCYNTASLKGSVIGGIVEYAKYATIEECYNTGNIKGSFNVGGIVGQTGAIEETDVVIVKNCYNTGKVTANERVGGIIGSLNTGAGTEVSNCYNVGNVTGDTKTGGISGFNLESKIDNCYYLSYTASGAINGVDDSTNNVIAVDENTLISNNFLTTLNNLDNKWIFFDENPYKYPVLNWQTNITLAPELTQDKYFIYTEQDLWDFATIVNDGENCENKIVYLMNDIQITSNETNKWESIGKSNDLAFQGTFEGNNNKISGIYSTSGFFSRIGENGIVENLTIENSTILGGGGIASYNYGLINNCSNKANITGIYWCGGIAGRNYGIINNCQNYGNVVGDTCVGGISGQNGDSEVGDEGKIYNCYNAGNVSGSGNYIGGITGGNNDTIQNCYNVGTITGGEESFGTGGIDGYCQGLIENCYNIGVVTGKYPGGVTGGTNGAIGINNCYYLDTTATYEKGYDEGVTGKLTSEEMKNISFVNLLNSNIDSNLTRWMLDIDNINNGYPIFVSQGEFKVTDIEIKQLPTKTTYSIGENIDTEGLILIAKYNDGTEEEITEGFTCTPTTLDTIGQQEIVVTYKELTATFNVSVEECKFEYSVNDDATTITITGYNGTDTTLIIPDTIDGYTVTSIESFAFFRCSRLTEIIIPKEVTSIGSFAFNECRSLKTINVNENNKNYSSEEGILFNKEKTKLIRYPEGKEDTKYTIPERVISIGDQAFYDCSNLTEIIIPEEVTSIGYNAFSGCSNLTEIRIPKGVTRIASYTFWGCSNLTEIRIPEGVESIESRVFSSCVSLVTIDVDENNKNYSSEEGILFNKEKTELIQYPEGKEDTKYIMPEGVTSIGNSAFALCNNLTEVIVPEGVTNIGNSAFAGCSNLTIYCKSDSYAKEYAEENSIDYIIDDEAPTVTSIEGNPEEWTKENVTLTVNAEDALSGLATEAYSFDGGETWQTKNTKTYTENTNGIVIKVKDALGNTYTSNEINITKIVLIGDANGDNKIDFMDILAINKHRLGKAQLTGAYLEAADVNGDNKVDFMDILQINKYRLGKIDSL